MSSSSEDPTLPLPAPRTGDAPAMLQMMLEAGAGGAVPEQPGSMIGRYRLMEKLGEGGFGIVWRAEQTEPIRREVALKVIKPGMDSREIIARFEAERQALALMDHPNIAAVLDAGATEGGRPYFVMELVRGAPITGYCDQRKLSVMQRIGLFVPVCQAVQHAHQKAILHRDLKPSNILVTEVDGKPVPKVIDFGIAKALEQGPAMQAPATMQGLILGTPQYMSPEQASENAQDVDTRADVYALGVIFFELLTGRTPLDVETLRRAGIEEVLRLIREKDTRRPSEVVGSIGVEGKSTAQLRATDERRLRAQLRGDLDWITLKALEKDRERRYASVGDLARDVEAYLQNLPVSAGPPSVTYRLRKLVRRNKLAFAAGAAVLLALVGGLTASAISYLREKAARADAVQARHSAEQLVNDVLFDLRDKLRPMGSVGLLQNMAQSAQRYLDAVPDKERTAATDKQRIAMLINLGDTFVPMGNTAEAGKCFDEAYELLERRIKLEPHSEDWERQEAVLLEKIAGIASNRGDQSRALKCYEAARDFWRRMKLEQPDNRYYERALSVSLNLVGHTLVKQGRAAEALPSFEEAVALSRALSSKKNKPVSWREDLATYLGNRSQALQMLKRRVEAEASVVEAIKLLDASLALQPRNLPLLRQVGIWRSQLGDLQVESKRWSEAKESYAKALAISKSLIAADPRNATWHKDVADIEVRLGDVARFEGNFAASATHLKASASTLQEMADDDPDNIAWQRDAATGWKRLAENQRDGHDIPGAQVSYGRSLDVLRKLEARKPLPIELLKVKIASIEGVGTCLSLQGKLDEASAHHRQALEIIAQGLKGDPAEKGLLRDRVVLLNQLALEQFSRMNYQGSLEHYREALKASEAIAAAAPEDGDSQWDLAAVRMGLADLLADKLNQPGEAGTLVEKNIPLCRMKVAKEPGNRRWSQALAMNLRRRAELDDRAGKTAEAEKIAREIVDIYNGLVARQPSDTEARSGLEENLAVLGGLHMKRGARAEAEDCYRKSLDHIRAMLRAAPRDVMLRMALSARLCEWADCLAAKGPEGAAGEREALLEAWSVFQGLKKAGELTPDVLASEGDLRKALTEKGITPP